MIEGGHSGELGELKPCYADGVCQKIEEREENPASYLWEGLDDGFFQRGAGGHYPTFAIKKELSKEQHEAIITFIKAYPFRDYSLTRRQCVSFVLQVAALAGLELSADVTLPISSEMEISGRRCRLWSDPQYAAVTFASPDRLERAFREAVIKGEVEDATSWYRCRFYKSHYRETIFRFPVRTLRLIRQKLH